MDKLVHPSGRETELVNTNRLIKYYSGCKCGKTGFTDEAGYCLSSLAEKNSMKMIAVALNCNTSADRFKECMELFNYGFTNFENKKVISKGEVLNQELMVVGGEYSKVRLIAEKDFYTINKRGDNDSIEIRYEVPSEVKAPILANDRVGKIIVLRQGIVIGEVNVLVDKDVLKQKDNEILIRQTSHTNSFNFSKFKKLKECIDEIIMDFKNDKQ
jgi:D-alanyl-D-alanine carboxypeptidase (penicillin-binding protein 5/6)